MLLLTFAEITKATNIIIRTKVIGTIKILYYFLLLY